MMWGITLLVCGLVLCSQLGALAQTATEYSATGRCTNVNVCTYNYVSHQRQFDGEEEQDVDFSAVVKLSCQSVGVYGSQSATRYCINLQNVQLDSDMVENTNGDTIDDGEPEERIDELQEFVNHTVEDAGDGTSRVTPQADSLNDQLFAKGFCFIQTADGRIADVIYSSGENIQVVNIKKSIASAFQANFQKEDAREEADVSGVHRASYKISSKPSAALSYTRKVASADVQSLAGVPSDLRLTSYEKEDRVTFDTRDIVQMAQGSMSMSLASLSSSTTTAPSSQTASLSVASKRIIGSAPDADARRKRSFTASRAATPDPDSATFDDSVDLDQELSASGTYTLTKVECSTLQSIIDSLSTKATPGTTAPPNTRAPRSANLPKEEDMSGMVKDSILARIDQVTIDKGRMSRLRRSLPSISDALHQLHQDPEHYKTANKIHDLLSLEAEHGPLPGYTPAIEEVLAYLVQIERSGGEKDVAMRQLLYSMLVTEGDPTAQKILVDMFSRMRSAGGDSSELTSLVTYLAFLRNSTKDTADRLHSLVEDNSDPLLLTLGSMAEYATEDVQEHIVAMLSARLSDKQDNDSVIHLLHSLGNTGSKAAVRVLLHYLEEEDLDIQLTAISSLRMHITSEMVQKALTQLLESTKQEEIVEGVIQMLLSAMRDYAQHPESEVDSAPLNTALVMAALQSNNPKLHSMLAAYLENVGTEHAKDLISVLIEFAESDPSLDQFEYDIDGETGNSSEAGRHRRGSDWDQYNSDYDIVASYSSRKNDVLTYPQHRAYIWGKKFGVSKVYAHFGAGGFVGASNNGQKYKIFAKAVAKGHAFGKTATAVHAEYLRSRSYNSVYQKIYVKIVGKVLKNEAGNVPLACLEKTYNLYQSNRITLLNFRVSVFIYVGTLDFYAKLYAKLRVDVRFCACEHYYTSCATLTPSITLQPSIGASATLLGLVRGGIEVSGNFEYRIEPEVCLKIDFQPSVKVTPCISVYHSWPNSYVEIYAYYQWRKLKLKWPPWKSYWYWSSKRRWSALSKKWTLSSTYRRLLWSSCGGSIVCDPNLTPTTPTPTTKPTTRPTVRPTTPTTKTRPTWIITTATTRPTTRPPTTATRATRIPFNSDLLLKLAPGAAP